MTLPTESSALPILDTVQPEKTATATFAMG